MPYKISKRQHTKTKINWSYGRWWWVGRLKNEVNENEEIVQRSTMKLIKWADSTTEYNEVNKN